MLIAEALGIGGFGLTLSAFIWKVAKDTDSKVGRVYQRLDEVKEKVDKDMDTHYTKKDVCEVIHKNSEQRLSNIETDIRDIKADMKTLLMAVKEKL